MTSPHEGHDSPRAPGSGAGLVGMRERVSLLGGTFTAGPNGAHWAVRAALPLTEGEDSMTAAGAAIRVLVAEDQCAVRAGWS